MPATSDAQQRDTRRRADAERSIAAILDAGLACFGTNPDVTMTAVARAAGVGRVTLYAHFPSRQALLEAVMAHAITKPTRPWSSSWRHRTASPPARRSPS
jgi:AcrR family transcriptional regulator